MLEMFYNRSDIKVPLGKNKKNVSWTTQLATRMRNIGNHYTLFHFLLSCSKSNQGEALLGICGTNSGWKKNFSLLWLLRIQNLFVHFKPQNYHGRRGLNNVLITCLSNPIALDFLLPFRK